MSRMIRKVVSIELGTFEIREKLTIAIDIGHASNCIWIIIPLNLAVYYPRKLSLHSIFGLEN